MVLACHVSLGDGRYAHAYPAPGGSVVIVESEAELGHLIGRGTMYDLYRPDVAPDADQLRDAVSVLRARATEVPSVRTSPCGRISKFPGVIFSDGTLLALAILKGFERNPDLLDIDDLLWIRNAVLVTAENGEGRLFCSGFVHRVLDAAGSRPKAPAPGESFLDLRAFLTDEPEYAALGVPDLATWILGRLMKTFDMDELTLRTCREVAHVIGCHFDLRTPPPDLLHVANFVTPGDLASSPSMHKIATRFHLPNGADSGWSQPLELPSLDR